MVVLHDVAKSCALHGFAIVSPPTARWTPDSAALQIDPTWLKCSLCFRACLGLLPEFATVAMSAPTSPKVAKTRARGMGNQGPGDALSNTTHKQLPVPKPPLSTDCTGQGVLLDRL